MIFFLLSFFFYLCTSHNWAWIGSRVGYSVCVQCVVLKDQTGDKRWSGFGFKAFLIRLLSLLITPPPRCCADSKDSLPSSLLSVLWTKSLPFSPQMLLLFTSIGKGGASGFGGSFSILGSKLGSFYFSLMADNYSPCLKHYLICPRRFWRLHENRKRVYLIAGSHFVFTPLFFLIEVSV